MRISSVFASAFAALAISSGSVSAQGGVTVQGVVVDQTGGVIPGATVRLLGPDDGRREVISDGTGHFVFERAARGRYTIHVEATAFQPAEVPITIEDTPPDPVTITLELSLSDEVVVTASRGELPVLPERNADVVKLDDDLLRDLPSDSQNVLSLAFGFLNPAQGGAGGSSVVVDGVDSDGLGLSAAAIRRIFVNRNPYSAEFRRPGRGRLEVVSERGSRNHVHGTVSLFARNAALDARNAFASTKPDLDRRLVEGSVATPLFGGRSALFVTGEHFTNRQSAIVHAQLPAGPLTLNVPTAETRQSWFGRLDVYPNEMHTFTLSYDAEDQTAGNLGTGGLHLPEQGYDSDGFTHRLQIAEHGVIAPVVNDVRVVVQHEQDRSGRLPVGPAFLVNGAFIGGSSQKFRSQHELLWAAQDVVTFFRGMHTVRAGAFIRRKAVSLTDGSDFGGTFQFASLEDFAANRPFLFRVIQGQPDLQFAETEAFAFVQDDLLVRPGLSVMLGLRYDWQSELADARQIAPRVAVAFAPGAQKTVVRTGVGVFYDRLPGSVVLRRRLLDGVRAHEMVIEDPSFPDPFASSHGQTVPPSVVRVSPGIRSPYLLQGSLGIEREVGARSQVALEYQALRGQRLFRAIDVNAPDAGQVRSDPVFLNVDQVESSAMRRSHTLSATFRGRVGSWLKLTTIYALSRTIDDSSGPLAKPADPRNLAAEVGRADSDRRHRLNLAGTITAFGFRVGAYATFASGPPFNITTGFDDNHDTVVNDRPVGVTRNTGQGPGLARVDLRLARLFRPPHPLNRIDQHSQFDVRVDMFNALNRTNFDNFIGVQRSPLFGRPVSADDARAIQLSCRYRF